MSPSMMNQKPMIYLGHCNSFVIGGDSRRFNRNQKCELCFSMLDPPSLSRETSFGKRRSLSIGTQNRARRFWRNNSASTDNSVFSRSTIIQSWNFDYRVFSTKYSPRDCRCDLDPTIRSCASFQDFLAILVGVSNLKPCDFSPPTARIH